MMRTLRAGKPEGIKEILIEDNYFFRVAWERSLELRYHSPAGPAWGYGGSGPSQLALAILLWAAIPEEQALDLYQEFKWEVVAKLPHEGWEIKSGDVKNWVWQKQGLRHVSDKPVWVGIDLADGDDHTIVKRM